MEKHIWRSICVYLQYCCCCYISFTHYYALFLFSCCAVTVYKQRNVCNAFHIIMLLFFFSMFFYFFFNAAAAASVIIRALLTMFTGNNFSLLIFLCYCRYTQYFLWKQLKIIIKQEKFMMKTKTKFLKECGSLNNTYLYGYMLYKKHSFFVVCTGRRSTGWLNNCRRKQQPL